MSNVIPFNRFRGYDFPETYPYFTPQPESPETAIARQSPEIAVETLEDISRKVLYKNLAESAGSLASTYLDCLKGVDSQNLRQSSQLDIGVEMIQSRGVKRLLFGREERGFNISIRLKR